jgi:hypothetical protein
MYYSQPNNEFSTSGELNSREIGNQITKTPNNRKLKEILTEYRTNLKIMIK